MTKAIRDLYLLQFVDTVAELRGSLVRLRDEALIIGSGRQRLGRLIDALDQALAKVEKAEHDLIAAENEGGGDPIEELVLDLVKHLMAEKGE